VTALFSPQVSQEVAPVVESVVSHAWTSRLFYLNTH
jgi:hypothetical protein